MPHKQPDYDLCPSLRTIAMPADANANGDIFGGWVLSQMDLAGSIIATQTSKTRVATVGIEAMSFKKPVYIGDEVSCYCRLERVGRTSMTVHIESWARARLDETAQKVTEGKFTYVAIDENRQPIPAVHTGK
ncbi:MAG: acyl-CoA thioesterase [Proteobacteria bacterium]|nr:acyl-CoA thioesterase [Pseudomonadota bacterium]